MDLEILKALSDFYGELFSLEKTLTASHGGHVHKLRMQAKIIGRSF